MILSPNMPVFNFFVGASRKTFQATLVCTFCNTDVFKVKISYTSVLIVLEMTEVTYLHLTTIGEFGEIFLPNQWDC